MKLIREILGALILFFDRIFPPRPIKRSSELQSQIDSKTKMLVLYQFQACPFCVKVRRKIKSLNLKIELKDAMNDPKAKDELIRGGGEYQTPCLRISKPDGTYQWMYESSDINSFLESQFRV